jgi:hypothetical protein
MIETVNVNIQILNQKVVELQQSISDKKSVEGKVKKLNQLETQIETNISKLKKDIEFFHNNDTCPTCRQSIGEEVKCEHISKNESKIKESTKGINDIAKLIDSETIRIQEIQSVLDQIQKHQVKIATDNTSIIEMNKYISKLQKQIDELAKKKTKAISGDHDAVQRRLLERMDRMAKAAQYAAQKQADRAAKNGTAYSKKKAESQLQSMINTFGKAEVEAMLKAMKGGE